REKRIHRDVLESVTDKIREKHFKIKGLDFSPVQGPKGNIEFLCFVEKLNENDPVETIPLKATINTLVENAHNTYVKKDEEVNE
ncbi:MAG: TlyA family rRNA (cytidine-2'-O)-methyltransferase, partial [Eubacterium sp.]